MKERCPLRMFWYFPTMGGVAANLITLNYLHCPAFKENTDNVHWSSALKTVRPSQCRRLCWWYVSWYVMWSGMKCRLERRKDVQLQVKLKKNEILSKGLRGRRATTDRMRVKCRWKEKLASLSDPWVREAVCEGDATLINTSMTTVADFRWKGQ